MIFFRFNGPSNCGIGLRSEPSLRCEVCGQSKFQKLYGDFPIQVTLPKKIKTWPRFMGGLGYHMFSEELVEVLAERVKGCRFHQLSKMTGTIRGTDKKPLPEWLPEPPKYFLMEPTGTIDFEVPVDEATECSLCGQVKKNEFGEYQKPLVPIMSEWNGSDVMCSKKVYPYVTIVSPKFINVLREHGWHHQPWYGLRNQKTEAIYFGSRAVPGLSAQNLDSDTWYEDTVAALKEKYPKEAEYLLDREIDSNGLSEKRNPANSIVIRVVPPFAFDPANPPNPQTSCGLVFLPDFHQNGFYSRFSHTHRHFGKKDYMIHVLGANEFTKEYDTLINLVLSNIDGIIDQIIEPYTEFYPSERIAKNLFLEPIIVIGNKNEELFDGKNWNLFVDYDQLFLTHIKFKFSGIRLVEHGAITMKLIASE